MYKTKHYYRRILRLVGAFGLISGILCYGYYKTHWKPSIEAQEQYVIKGIDGIKEYARKVYSGEIVIKEEAPIKPTRKPAR